MASDMLWKYICNSISRFHMAIWVVKQVLLSIGIISTVLMLNPTPKISYTFSLLCYGIPSFCAWLKIWLSPPYAYIIINFILILIIIIASSFSSSPSSSSSLVEEFTALDYSSLVEECTAPLDYSSVKDVLLEVSGDEEAPVKTSMVMDDSRWNCIAEETAVKLESTAVVPGQNESLEATWKAILEEHGIPATRHLRKSETWDMPPSCGDGSSSLVPREREMRKSSTFVEARSSFRETQIPYLREDELLSHDELNRKVEEFIQKCRNQMRLERVESDQRLMDILNGGV
ncbi:hypothetical protein VitviT2T_026768 [Vitis vinifera]|uniref:DUF4408 domain-containing protein n=1 Tax=Vitis vinifera TaxID=29760 RepID=A0ABY9DR48_VITVI|nr:uncharacterized protein LOC104882441 [Vitis vinifera]WKA09090.1 hypothetical protein VitviT2T_026768 [Vitis vinifera]|eukprot:XP_010663956.1 PREDICTED: uncharacterized protein LOC104882441 [Vitis vinifera]